VAQVFGSPVPEIGVPFVWGAEETVEVEEVEELEAIEDAELDRRSMSFLAWGPFIELMVCPPLIPHDGRLRLEKLGGLATAVI
jgi:hypothetical protein